MSTYLSLLDTSCLFEFLVRLPYPDLRSILVVKPALYRITNSEHFDMMWKKYNITVRVSKDVIITTEEIDTLGLKHGYVRKYGYNNVMYEESFYVQDKIWSCTRWYRDDDGNYIEPKQIHTYIQYSYSPDKSNENDTSEITDYNLDGSIQERISTRNGLRHGISMGYHDDTGIYIRDYHKGQLGRWFNFYPNGHLCSMTDYRPMRTFTSYHFHENGKKRREIPHKNGKPYGFEKQWNDQGELTLCRSLS